MQVQAGKVELAVWGTQPCILAYYWLTFFYLVQKGTRGLDPSWIRPCSAFVFNNPDSTHHNEVQTFHWAPQETLPAWSRRAPSEWSRTLWRRTSFATRCTRWNLRDQHRHQQSTVAHWEAPQISTRMRWHTQTALFPLQTVNEVMQKWKAAFTLLHNLWHLYLHQYHFAKYKPTATMGVEVRTWSEGVFKLLMTFTSILNMCYALSNSFL